MRAAFQGVGASARMPTDPARHPNNGGDLWTRPQIRTHPLTGGLIAKTTEHRTRLRKCTVLNPCQASEPTKQALQTPGYPQGPPEWPSSATSMELRGGECSSPTWTNSGRITPLI